jgi:hypothetical protein
VTFSQIKSRARSYLMAASNTYSIIEQRFRSVFGYTEARRIRRASESCAGCITYSYVWMPIAQLPEISTLDCGSRCRCFIEYR